MKNRVTIRRTIVVISYRPEEEDEDDDGGDKDDEGTTVVGESCGTMIKKITSFTCRIYCCRNYF